MSVVSASLMTGVIRPPSGIATASATLMRSLYVTPAPSVVVAARFAAGSALPGARDQGT